MASKNEWPPSLRRWLAKCMSGLRPAQSSQAQQELKLVVKSVMEKNIVWKVNWDEQPGHNFGDVQGTIDQILKSINPKPKPTIPTHSPGPVQVVPQSSTEHYQHSQYQQPPYQQPQYQSYQQPVSVLPQPYTYDYGYSSYQPNAHAVSNTISSHQGYNLNNPQYFQGQSIPPTPTFATQPPINADDGARMSSAESWDNRPRKERASEQNTSDTSWKSDVRQQQQSSNIKSSRKSAWDIPNEPSKSKRSRYLEEPEDVTMEESSTNDTGFVPPSYEEITSALRNFIVHLKSQSLPLNKVNDFYELYPKYRSVAQGNFKNIVSSPGSGLKMTKRSVELDMAQPSIRKKKQKESDALGIDDNDNPEKRAARAARFVNDNLEMQSSSSYEKISEDSQRVAAALESAQRAGKEVDWSSLVLKGTCTKLEKSFLRLTAPPDPSTVRPEPVLKKALQMVLTRLKAEGEKAYAWASDQLKSIRQDLRVQHIRNAFTVQVYEAHARAAIKYGAPDFQEFNQSCTQLQELYNLGIGEDTNRSEFSAYLLLYHIYCKSRYNYPSSVITLSLFKPINRGDLNDPEYHAHAMHLALDTNDWIRFLRLHAICPGLGRDLLRPLLLFARVRALEACCISSKTIPKQYLVNTLQLGDVSEWNKFCSKTNIVFNTPDVIDSKATLNGLSHLVNDGSIWSA